MPAITKKNIYIALPEADAKLLKELIEHDLGTSIRKGVEQIISTYVRQPEVRQLVQSKANETKLKLLEEEMARVKSTMADASSPPVPPANGKK